ncbi:stromal membrane-associated protein 1 isoform X2 [Exaiptasia diaphana]|uniref:Arf-GAP domain-containing protein n=1 Tax=Exaiptasia diaphana TaxID=2652724 RepID=A0A913XIV1_EXADI|nr:stromal membrane-associated protein 1 isoform X2 [Exaiptasia diaphana]XP_020913712.1 stromal membrane-associated protein 1 isoform X2 [Exaiptasia diaphana]
MAARSQREKDHTKNKNQVILAEMLKEESNKYCSDCGAKGPRWASWNLGVFLCIRCAGIHRNLGVHISKVKSVNLDSWTPEQMTNIQDWGNRRAGMYWECFLPKDFHRPQTNSAVETFIRNKYEHKKYVKKDGLPPKSDLNVAASAPKQEKITKKKKQIEDQTPIVIPKIQETINKTNTTVPVSRPKVTQPQPSAPAIAPVIPATSKPNPPSADLLSLDTPAPVVNQQPAQPAPQPTSLADELASLSQNAAPVNNEESLLKDDTSTSKSTKDSIMALFGSSTGTSSSNHQPQMYGVPGGMYITSQQQPAMQKAPHTMMNGPHMHTGPYQHHMMPMHMPQQRLMQHATPQQQQAQLSQIQSQMQQLKLQKNPQAQFPQMQQQPNQFNMYNSNQTMLGQQQAMNLMTNQHMMHYQQQQPQFVSTGPVYNASPMAAMPTTGHTFNNQLWK